MDNDLALPVSSKVLAEWQDLQIKKMPTWFQRLKTKRKDLLPANDLDVHVDLFENALRGMAGFGGDYTIERDNITYQGNLMALKNALVRDKLKGVIVETYPQNTLKNLGTMPNWLVLSELMGILGIYLQEGGGWLRFQQKHEENVMVNNESKIVVSSPKIKEVIGLSRIRFVFGLRNPKTELSIDAQVQNRSAQYPSLAELLFYRWGDRDIQDEERREVFRIRNEFNVASMLGNSTTVGFHRYYHNDLRSYATGIYFYKDVMGKKYNHYPSVVSLYVL